MSSYTLRIGGEAGWGIASAADILAKLFLKIGYHVFSSKDYASQIKGGHNYHTVRAGVEKLWADVNGLDLLLALDLATLERHESKVVSGGIILYDGKMNISQLETSGKKYLKIPLTEIEEKLKEKNLHNAVFLGATVKVLGLDFNLLEDELEFYFSKKEKLKKVLIKAAEEGYNYVDKVNELHKLEKNKCRFLNGNEAVALGALKTGLTFHAQYPMTPVSGILHFLAAEAVGNKNMQVVQAEDEIAVINMALGASFAGARAMVATSGGGFSLMVESLGLAGMAEIPLVIIEGQRPGPATGLPTKNEQGDLKFVLSAAQGDFPRVVIAPGTIEECYTETKRAFYLAEKYCVPVIILIDKQLAESFQDVNLQDEEKKFVFDYAKRINILDKVNDSELNPDGLFKRYAGENRTLPMTPRGMYTCAGDEHDEVGYIAEDPEIRKRMMERRMNKLELIKKELPPPSFVGPENADFTVVSWGSNYGAILEAIEMLNGEGKNINFLSLKYLCPFLSDKVKVILEKAKKKVLVENNYSGQLGNLIREKTGIEIKDKILRYDGTTFTVDEIIEELKKWLN